MRWPWQRRKGASVSEETKRSAERAAAELRRLAEQQPEVDGLEAWARRESRVNGFSERMRRGMGGQA